MCELHKCGREKHKTAPYLIFRRRYAVSAQKYGRCFVLLRRAGVGEAKKESKKAEVASRSRRRPA